MPTSTRRAEALIKPRDPWWNPATWTLWVVTFGDWLDWLYSARRLRKELIERGGSHGEAEAIIETLREERRAHKH